MQVSKSCSSDRDSSPPDMPSSASSVNTPSSRPSPLPVLTVRLQHSETTVPDLLQQLDTVERASGPKKVEDPFNFRSAYKNEAQLFDLRKRRKGKGLERYHRQQNNVPLNCPRQWRRR